MNKPDIFFISLITDLEALLELRGDLHRSELLLKIFQIRNCVIKLIGPYSENIIWDIAISHSRLRDMPDKLESTMHHLRMFAHPDTSVTEKVKNSMENLINFYTIQLSRLIGQEMLNRHLRGCSLFISQEKS